MERKNDMRVSIKTQKILMFIPFVNALIWFIWLYNCIKMKVSTAAFMKSLLRMFAVIIPLAMVQLVLSKVFPDTSDILGYIMMYLAPLSMAFCLIRFQERLYEND